MMCADNLGPGWILADKAMEIQTVHVIYSAPLYG